MGRVVQVFAFALYPLALYLGLARWNVRASAGLLGVAALLSAAARWKSRSLRGVWFPPALIAALATLGWWLQDPLYLKLLPVLINGALLGTFGASLFGAMPMVERFARLQGHDLSNAERRYCRAITLVWSGFFVVNGGVCLALALGGSLSAWAIYTGVIAYVLMGALMSGEYVFRKLRFRRFGDVWHDRLLSAILSRAAPR